MAVIMMKMREIFMIYISLIMQLEDMIRIMELYYLFMEVHGLKDIKKVWISFVKNMLKWDI